MSFSLASYFTCSPGLRPHPPLRLPRQSKAYRSTATVFRCSPGSSTPSPIRTFDRTNHPALMALPQLRWTDGRCRTIHGSTTPAPFSTAPCRGCMKSLAHIPRRRRTSERFAEVCLRYTQTSSSCPRPGSLRRRRVPSAPGLTTPANFSTPYSLHSICIGPASAAPAASF